MLTVHSRNGAQEGDDEAGGDGLGRRLVGGLETKHERGGQDLAASKVVARDWCGWAEAGLCRDASSSAAEDEYVRHNGPGRQL